MIYRFVIVSAEVRTFRRDIRIGSSATFEELRLALYDDLGYSPLERSIFYLTDHSWKRGTPVYEEEPPYSRSDEDIFLMHNTRLDELLTEERERLILIHDVTSSRQFYLELREITSGHLTAPEISRSEGEPPVQQIQVEEPPKEEKRETKVKKDAVKQPSEDDETVEKKKKLLNEESTPDEYGSDAFDSTELDPEGFGTADESGEFDNEVPPEDYSF